MTREEAIEILQGAIKKPNTKDGYLGQAIDMAIQALSQEPCEDAISREAVLEQINCWIGSGEYRYTNATYYLTERIKHISSAKPQEPCEDAISREWLMRKATERFYTTNYFNHISAMIEEAPSVTQKSGKWIDDEFGSSCCGIHTHIDKFDRHMKFKYCSMCGAKMVEPQEREDEE